MGEARNPPAPSLLAEEWDEAQMTAWTFPSPWCSWGRDRESFMQGETPNKTQPLCLFLQIPRVPRESFAHFWASCMSLLSPLPRGGPCYLRKLNLLLFLLNFPFWLRRWWDRRMSLSWSLFQSSLVQIYRYFFSFSSSSRSFSLFLCSADLTSQSWGE